MKKAIEGKVIVITGASSGMGEALIKSLPELHRRHTRFLLKKCTERLRVFKTQGISNFTHR